MVSTGTTLPLVYVRSISHVMSLGHVLFEGEGMYRMNAVFVMKYSVLWPVVTLDQDKILHGESQCNICPTPPFKN
jgi:hypothetical protein